MIKIGECRRLVEEALTLLFLLFVSSFVRLLGQLAVQQRLEYLLRHRGELLLVPKSGTAVPLNFSRLRGVACYLTWRKLAEQVGWRGRPGISDAPERAKGLKA